jgi:hypothetical protein
VSHELAQLIGAIRGIDKPTNPQTRGRGRFHAKTRALDAYTRFSGAALPEALQPDPAPVTYWSRSIPIRVPDQVAARSRGAKVLVPAWPTDPGVIARRVPAQAGDHRIGVTAVRINRDPATAAPRSPPLEPGRVHRRIQKAATVKRVAHSARAVVTARCPSFVPSAPDIWTGADPICGRDHCLDRGRGACRCNRQPVDQPSLRSRHGGRRRRCRRWWCCSRRRCGAGWRDAARVRGSWGGGEKRSRGSATGHQCKLRTNTTEVQLDSLLRVPTGLAVGLALKELRSHHGGLAPNTWFPRSPAARGRELGVVFGSLGANNSKSGG